MCGKVKSIKCRFAARRRINIMVKSHEFISKTILKNFSFSDGGKKRAVKYMKLPNTRIRHGDIKTFNTRLGAYTDENERILNSEFETYLGDLNAIIEKALKTDRILRASDFDMVKIKKYFMYQCLRDDVFVDDLLFGMKQTELFNDFEGLDISQVKNRLITEAFNSNFADEMFKGYSPLVAIDDNAGLIGSNYIVSLAGNGGCTVLSIALSPKVLFLLVHQGLLEGSSLALNYIKNSKSEKDGGGAWKILGAADAANINITTLRLGMKLGFGYVISKSEKKLHETIQSLK